MSAAVAELRRVLATRFPNAVPLQDRTVPQLPTGLAPLDRILPGGGLPRGRLSVWQAGLGGGAVLRSMCMQALSRGERAVWIEDWEQGARGVSRSDLLLVRPDTERQSLECAEELLRCGGFAVVVLAGRGSSGRERVRLTRAAREGGAALVEFSREAHLAAVRISSRIDTADVHWQCNRLGEPVEMEWVRLRVQVLAGGWSRESEVVLMVGNHEHCLSLDPGLADRRGLLR